MREGESVHDVFLTETVAVVCTQEGKHLVCRILSEPGAIAWKLLLPPHDALTITDETILLRTSTTLQVYRAR